MTPPVAPAPGLYPELIRERLAHGWTEERALTTPPRPRARVTPSTVREARESCETAAQLADELGISRRHARQVRERRAWKSV